MKPPRSRRGSMFAQPDADNFVFNSQKSTQMNRVTVYKLFKAIAKKAGLGETLQHPHVLKHTAAMLMVQQGCNAFMIRQHLGHRSFRLHPRIREPIGRGRLGGFSQSLRAGVLAGYKVRVLLHSSVLAGSKPAETLDLFSGRKMQRYFSG